MMIDEEERVRLAVDEVIARSADVHRLRAELARALLLREMAIAGLRDLVDDPWHRLERTDV